MTVTDYDRLTSLYLIYKVYKGSGNEIKKSKFLHCTSEIQKATATVIKHIQLFVADVDIKGWLKILFKQCFFYHAMC